MSSTEKKNKTDFRFSLYTLIILILYYNGESRNCTIIALISFFISLCIINNILYGISHKINSRASKEIYEFLSE